MASHYKLYNGMGEVIPFSARYSYPTQANRAWKSVVKIPSKNGSVFQSNQSPVIRIELPAQGYLDTGSSFLQFDLSFNVDPTSTNCHLQNNAQSWIKRARWIYGSLVGEDLRDYNVLVRNLTEGTGTNNNFVMDQTALSEGVGGIRPVADTAGAIGMMNVRNYDIQTANFSVTGGQTLAPSGGLMNQPRRYQVQLGLGLLQQNKLLPLKWMASQLAIELEMAPFNECCCHSGPGAGGDFYTVSNVSYVAHLVEFDGTYDAAFLEGLRGGGIPIKFGSWNTYLMQPAPSNNQTLMIPERNRSLKAAFCVQLPPPRASTAAAAGAANLPWDSHAFLESSAGLNTDTGEAFGTWMVSYQWRIGGKYYPSQAVTLGDTQKTNGGVEAYSEYAKALNIVGDYRLSTSVNPSRWVKAGGDGAATAHSTCYDWWGSENTAAAAKALQGPSSFVISADFETSGGDEVSGLNGEEQNDIALMIQYGGVTTGGGNGGMQNPQCLYDVFVYYDALLILRENNMVELIK